MDSPNFALTPEILDRQLGAAYGGFSQDDRARHIEMLRSLERPEDVSIDVRKAAPGNWTLTVCTADRLGVLSIITGLLTVYGLEITCADVFTIELPRRGGRHVVRPTRGRRSMPPLPPATGGPLRRTLDVFEVSADSSVGFDLWQRYEEELAGLTSLLAADRPEEAFDRVIDQISATLPVETLLDTALLPMSIQLTNQTNEEAAPYTRLEIRSADIQGFLFAFTNALAGSTFDIKGAAIRTVAGEAHDIFWITDRHGQRLERPEDIQELRATTALVKQFTYLLPRSPDPGQALRQFRALVRQMLARPDWATQLANLESVEVLETLADLMGVSRFLWEDFLRLQYENLFPVLVDLPALESTLSKVELEAALQEQLADAVSVTERIDRLNAFKDREMFRIDLRHITGKIGFRAFSLELSALAEVVVAGAAELTHQSISHPISKKGSVAVPRNGQLWPWCIGALGKFGGEELGYGSDIELIFLYQKPLQTEAGFSPGLYFEEFVRTFPTVVRSQRDGIFDIDLRLRPYGRTGPLVSTLDYLRAYYSDEGPAQQFERMALVKLRPVAGDMALGVEMLKMRDAFVYSGKPLDVDNIRHLRQRQAVELVPLGAVNAKYSAGGLVDIEYYIQVMQIQAGHTDATVRVMNTLDAIARLEAGGHIQPPIAAAMRDSFGFLRGLIDALRAVRGNAKDLNVPPNNSRAFAYLTQRLHYDSAAALKGALEAHMGFAARLWDP